MISVAPRLCLGSWGDWFFGFAAVAAGYLFVDVLRAFTRWYNEPEDEG